MQQTWAKLQEVSGGAAVTNAPQLKQEIHRLTSVAGGYENVDRDTVLRLASKLKCLELEECFHILSSLARTIIGMGIPEMNLLILNLIKTCLSDQLRELIWDNRILCNAFLVFASVYLKILVEEDDYGVFAKLFDLAIHSLHQY